jgi:hypothetical protein
MVGCLDIEPFLRTALPSTRVNGRALANHKFVFLPWSRKGGEGVENQSDDRAVTDVKN